MAHFWTTFFNSEDNKSKIDFGGKLLFFISLRIFSYYYYLLIKVNHNCLWHNGASLAFYWREFLPSLWQFFQKESDSQVTQLVGPQSNDLMQPTALVQTCSLPVVSTCFWTGPKLCHPLNYHSLSTPVVKRLRFKI